MIKIFTNKDNHILEINNFFKKISNNSHIEFFSNGKLKAILTFQSSFRYSFSKLWSNEYAIYIKDRNSGFFISIIFDKIYIYM